MITFRAMTLLAVLRPVRALALAAMLPCALVGQTPLSHLDDAAPIPQGMLRFAVTNAWTRFDQRYGPGGTTVSIDDGFATYSLGADQLPRLAPLEAPLKTLAGDAQMRLSFGRFDPRSDARIVTTPISLELGVTQRLSVGVMVPIVQTRRVVGLLVNPNTGPPANVGFVPEAARGQAARDNAAVATSYEAAAANLAQLIARCQATPTGTGCGPVNANAADAAAAQAGATAYAAAARALAADSAHALVAPDAHGSLALEIELRRNALNDALQRFLGAGAGSSTRIFFTDTAGNAPFGYYDLNGTSGRPGLLQSPLGGGIDSVRITELVHVGDIEVGARYLVFDRFQRDSLPRRGLQTRLAIAGALRFATSRVDSAQNLVDIGTGDGAGVEVRSMLDLVRGHFGGTIGARYAKYLARTVTASLVGDPEAPWPYPIFGERKRTAGDVIGLDLTPRFLLVNSFAIDGHYGIERRGATTYDAASAVTSDPLCPTCVLPPVPTGSARTSHQLGLGLRYSTVDAYARGLAPYPIEVSYTHLETVRGDPGVPKLSREQVQMRLFFRVLGR
jgi:hypothetical protein